MLNEKITSLLAREDARQQNIPLISEEEKKRRREAFKYAQASISLEGFSLSDAYEKEVERFIQGEIDFPALTNQLHEIMKHHHAQ